MRVNDRDLHVEIHGPPDGPLLVLLHHGLGTVRAWKAQIPDLIQAGWRVVVYDRWGYGRSQPRQFLSAPDFGLDLDDLEDILINIGAKEISLVGHSDGGTIALYYAARHPEYVSRLVTVAAHIYLEPKMEPGIKGIRQVFETDKRFRAAFSRTHGAKAENTFWNWFNAWTQPQNWGWDMRPLLGSITCPTLVIQGLEDEHATPQHAKDIAAAVPGAQLWLAPDAGHMLPQEAWQVFNRRVVDFLAPEVLRKTSEKLES